MLRRVFRPLEVPNLTRVVGLEIFFFELLEAEALRENTLEGVCALVFVTLERGFVFLGKTTLRAAGFFFRWAMKPCL